MSSAIQHKKPIPVSQAIVEMLVSERVHLSHNTMLIFNAWDEVSGAAQYTVRRFFRDGKLYITLNSSAARSSLMFGRDALVAGINSLLEANPLFIKEGKGVSYVREIILK